MSGLPFNTEEMQRMQLKVSLTRLHLNGEVISLVSICEHGHTLSQDQEADTQDIKQ